MINEKKLRDILKNMIEGLTANNTVPVIYEKENIEWAIEEIQKLERKPDKNEIGLLIYYSLSNFSSLSKFSERTARENWTAKGKTPLKRRSAAAAKLIVERWGDEN